MKEETLLELVERLEIKNSRCNKVDPKQWIIHCNDFERLRDAIREMHSTLRAIAEYDEVNADGAARETLARLDKWEPEK